MAERDESVPVRVTARDERMVGLAAVKADPVKSTRKVSWVPNVASWPMAFRKSEFRITRGPGRVPPPMAPPSGP